MFDRIFQFFQAFWFVFPQVASSLIPKWKVYWCEIRWVWRSFMFQITEEDADLKHWVKEPLAWPCSMTGLTITLISILFPFCAATHSRPQRIWRRSKTYSAIHSLLKPENREILGINHSSTSHAFGTCCLSAFRHIFDDTRAKMWSFCLWESGTNTNIASSANMIFWNYCSVNPVFEI